MKRTAGSPRDLADLDDLGAAQPRNRVSQVFVGGLIVAVAVTICCAVAAPDMAGAATIPAAKVLVTTAQNSTAQVVIQASDLPGYESGGLGGELFPEDYVKCFGANPLLASAPAPFVRSEPDVGEEATTGASFTHGFLALGPELVVSSTAWMASSAAQAAAAYSVLEGAGFAGCVERELDAPAGLGETNSVALSELPAGAPVGEAHAYRATLSIYDDPAGAVIKVIGYDLTVLRVGRMVALLETDAAELAASGTPFPEAEREHLAALLAERMAAAQRSATGRGAHRDGRSGHRVARSCVVAAGGGPSLPLHTEGRWIKQCDGRKLTLESVNWSGAQTVAGLPWGLEAHSAQSIALAIRRAGFNSVRLPWTDEMLELPSRSAELASFMNVVEALAGAGLLIILDDHSTDAMPKAHGGCSCDPADGNGPWWTGYGEPYWRYGPDYGAPAAETIDEANVRKGTRDWIEDWEALLRRIPPGARSYVVGADLRNEPRDVCTAGDRLLVNGSGKLGGDCQGSLKGSLKGISWSRTQLAWQSSTKAFDWSAAAQQAGRRLTRLDPGLLIMVEGVDNSGNFTEVEGHPIEGLAGHLVYSPHEYREDTTDYHFDLFCRHRNPDRYADLRCLLGDNWGYLVIKHRSFTAPVWVGEFGTSVPALARPTAGTRWFHNFVRYLRSNGIGWSYWQLYQPGDCFSALQTTTACDLPATTTVPPLNCALYAQLSRIGLRGSCAAEASTADLAGRSAPRRRR